MSKVAVYLQEHILGEVSTNPTLLDAMSRDGGVLQIMPEMVLYPRITNDIRKVARFAWQLAEKGHVLSLTARGNGADQTGAAIGKGAIISLPAHMNRIFELDTKQKLVRVQPGVGTKALNDALMLHGVSIPSLPRLAPYGTVGGAVANNASGLLAGRYGATGDWVHQLEVVLANGDLIQTGRLSKRELSKRKGKQTFEGEVYRGIDALIDENQQLINDKLVSPIRDNVGYSSIAKVKRKDGSFDLTPLIVGSQGTLGIISELIMKNEFMSAHTAVVVAAFTSRETARDALDALSTLQPTFMDYFDGELFVLAAAQGKKFDFTKELSGKLRAVIVLGFDDFSEHARLRKLKKAHKLLAKTQAMVESGDGDDAIGLLAVREVGQYAAMVTTTKEISAVPLLDGAYVPGERFEDFIDAVAGLAKKYAVDLPLHSRVLDNIQYVRPMLQLHKVGDKQKVFKLLDEYSAIVEQYGGHLIGEDGEGRIKAQAAYRPLDPAVRELFVAVKAIFDPYGLLNPGVKQENDMRQLTSWLRTSGTGAAAAE
jgi:FAD/FMN-containing dehydrogenase